MPAKCFDICYGQESRSNFDAMRPLPVCVDANQGVGQEKPQYISTNCYYGYHNANVTAQNNYIQEDCDMTEVTPIDNPSHSCNARKRSHNNQEDDFQPKRLREEVQREKANEPETYGTKNLDVNLDEDLMWYTHGATVFSTIQCSEV